jgi:hypothetical protein
LSASHILSIVNYEKMPFLDAIIENITIILKKTRLSSEFTVRIEEQASDYVTLLRTVNQNNYLDRYKHSLNIYEDELSNRLLNEVGAIKLSLLCNINQGIAIKNNRGKSITLDSNYDTKDPLYKLLDGRDINRYAISWSGKYLIYNIDRIHSCKRKDIFVVPEKLLFRRVSRNLIFAYDNNQYFCLNTLVLVTMKNDCAQPPIKYLLAVLNSKLMDYIYNKTYRSTKKVFSEIQARSIGQLPILVSDNAMQKAFVERANILLELKDNKLQNDKLIFMDFTKKYTASYEAPIKNSIAPGAFINYIYKGNSSKISALTSAVNDRIVTIYSNVSSGSRYELIKFEVKDHYQRQYLKLYLENLTEEQLTEINQYSGNILDKVLQITIPDYDKPEVVRKVVNEWSQLQAEITDLKKKIEETDKEIDQMVYELYGLTEDEIKIVEEETN